VNQTTKTCIVGSVPSLPERVTIHIRTFSEECLFGFEFEICCCCNNDDLGFVVIWKLRISRWLDLVENTQILPHPVSQSTLRFFIHATACSVRTLQDVNQASDETNGRWTECALQTSAVSLSVLFDGKGECAIGRNHSWQIRIMEIAWSKVMSRHVQTHTPWIKFTFKFARFGWAQLKLHIIEWTSYNIAIPTIQSTRTAKRDVLWGPLSTVLNWKPDHDEAGWGNERWGTDIQFLVEDH
jgi:hypothetical protein